MRMKYSSRPEKDRALGYHDTHDTTLPPQCSMHEGSYRRLANSCVVKVNMVLLLDRIFDMACHRHSTGEISDAILAIRRCRGGVTFKKGGWRGARVVCSVKTTTTASAALIYSRTTGAPEYNFESFEIDVEDTRCDRYAGGVVYLACADMWAEVEKQIFRDLKSSLIHQYIDYSGIL